MLSRVFLALALFAVVASAQDSDPCGQWSPCTVCLTHPFCGWCSSPVTYKDGTQGKQCAGFNPNSTSEPFVCNGVYSTEKCEVGYTCDPASFTCLPAAPGEGVPLDQCKANCTNDGSTYLCNNATETCEKTTPGQGTSLQVCMMTCSNTKAPTSSPGPTGPTANPTPAPITQAPTKPPPTPSPTPATIAPVGLIGLWRGIQVNTAFHKGEFSIEFKTSTATFVLFDKTTILANVASMANGLTLTITSPAALAGKVLSGVYQKAGNGPETNYLELAFGAVGAPAPASFTAAMTDPLAWALWLSECLTPTCQFHLSNQVSLRRQLLQTTAPSGDYCHAFGDNCTYCVGHKDCGWCSTNVVYQDGTTGNQCAGFNPNNTRQPFTCSGAYSTLECAVGYTCNTSSTGNKSCELAPPGDGQPLAACQASCQNPAQNYRCDNATKQCVVDPKGGSQAECQSYCPVKPSPTPITPTILLGMWRGIEIKNGYTVGEFDLAFNGTSATLTANGVIAWVCNVSTQGPLLVFTVTQGPGNLIGDMIRVMYQYGGDAIFNFATFAFGQPSGLIPATFDEAMTTTGETEYVMAKCATPQSCSF